LAIGIWGQTIEWFLVFSLSRTMGWGIVWTNATSLFQTLAQKEHLGRVLGAQHAGSTLVEASIATLIGTLQDAGWDKHWLALLSAGIGSGLVGFWALCCCHGCLSHGGAAPIAMEQHRPVQQLLQKETELSELDDESIKF
jgi:hypothetical protein